MNITKYLIFLFFIANAALGQNLKSFNHVTSNGFQEAFSIKTLSNGSYFLVSHFTGSILLGNENFTSTSQDVLISYFSKDNQYKWSKQLGNTKKDFVTDVALTSDQKLVFSISYLKTILATPFSFTSTNDSTYSLAVITLDTNQVFTNGFKISSLTNENNLKLTAFGTGLILSGSFKSDYSIKNYALPNANASIIYTANTDLDGNVIWVKYIGTLTQINEIPAPEKVVIDQLGNIYIGGTFVKNTTFGTINFISQTITSVGLNDVFVLKYTQLGDLKWVKSFGSEYDSRFSDLVIDIDQNPILAMGFNGTLIVNGEAFTSKGEDAIAMILDQNNGKMTKRLVLSNISNQIITAIATDKDKNLYLAGEFIGPMNVAGTNGNYMINTIYQYRSDLFFAKYDSTLVLTWAQAQIGYGVERINHIEIDHNQQLYFSGLATNELDFRTKNSNNFVKTTDKSADIIFGKICMQDSINGCIETPLLTSIDEKIVENSEFDLYPNPASTSTTLKIKSGSIPQFVLLRDVNGKLLSQIKDLKNLNTEITVSNYPSGLYFVTIVFEKHSITKKLIVQK